MPGRRVAEHHYRAEFHDLPFLFVYRGSVRCTHVCRLVDFSSYAWRTLLGSGRLFLPKRCPEHALSNPLGLKHLIRIRPHPGELPLPHRLAHSAVDTNRPAALLRIFDLDCHAPDTLDFDRSSLAVLHRTQPLVIGAAGEHIADLEGRDLRRPGDDLANRMLHVISVVILAQLLVFPKLHTEFLWVGNFITSHDPWSHRAERIRRLVNKEHAATQAAR